MFWVFKLSFVVDILAFFDLATFSAIFQQIWQIFFWSSRHSVRHNWVVMSKAIVFKDKKISWDDVTENYKIF
jgi:hypothetical protein